MKVTEYIDRADGSPLISFEVLPPPKGGSVSDIFKTLDPLMEFEPPFVDVTYHREEYLYRRRSSGYYEKTAIRKRPGTVGICAAIMQRYEVDPVPHLICGGFTQEDTENALIDLNFLQIENVLAIRGDASKFDGKFIPEIGGHKYALDLIRQVENMNQGIYLDENIENGAHTNMCIGVAGYPEKHFEAPCMDLDLDFLEQKIEAGGDYIVTQMFFDNQKFFEFEKKCRDRGITVPIIPGLKPLTKFYQLQSLPRIFHLNIPEEFAREVYRVREDKEKVRQVGIEWSIEQAKELIAHGVPCLHYYTMGDAKTIHQIVKGAL